MRRENTRYEKIGEKMRGQGVVEKMWGRVFFFCAHHLRESNVIDTNYFITSLQTADVVLAFFK